MTTRSRAGVTFWKVLIVLAIIAFMVAFLFPVFNKTGTRNRRRDHASRQSNLKMLGLVYTQYSQDADGAFPPGANAAGNGWAGQVYPLIKSVGVYQCPDDPAQDSFVSYAENRNLVGQSISKFTNPASTVALYETTTLNRNPSATSLPESASATGLAAPLDSDRHAPQTHGLNFLAVDGHVQFWNPAQVSSGPGALTAQKITQTRTGPVFLTFSVK